MATKRVLLLLTSDRLSSPIIRHITSEGKTFGWKIRIGCMFDPGMSKRISEEKFAIEPEYLDIAKMQECDHAIKKSDLVISMVTDSLLLQVADSCIQHRKSLITPSSLNRQMAAKKAEAKERNVLILMDCGYAPGLDHITAKKAIDNIHLKGGKITSFKTYSGSFVYDSSCGNPLGFKVMESIGELLCLGKQNNRHVLQGHLQHVPYNRLFGRGEKVNIRGQENTMGVPAGDALYYKKIYGLRDALTVVKGKLLPKGLDRMLDLFIKLGLTDNISKIDLAPEESLCNFLDSFLPYSDSASIEERLQTYTGANNEDIEKLKWLGLFDASLPGDQKDLTPARFLQQLLESRLTPKRDDQDSIIMQHQLVYEFRDEEFEFTATLVSTGNNQSDSALAKAIGLTCGIAAKCVLLGTINEKGVHIPILREIYDPILNELSDLGVAFYVEDKKIREAEPAFLKS